MNNQQENNLWSQFLTTGKVNDYLAYKMMDEDSNEGQRNTYNNARTDNT